MNEWLPALISSLGGGAIGSAIGGLLTAIYTSKSARKNKLDDVRREKIADWRAYLVDPEWRKYPIFNIPCYSQIRPHLSVELRASCEKPRDSTIVIYGDANGRTMRVTDMRQHPWDDVLDRLGELEKDWVLV